MLSGMTRSQMFFPIAMLTWLRAEAKRRGTTVSEVVRSFIQREMDKK